MLLVAAFKAKGGNAFSDADLEALREAGSCGLVGLTDEGAQHDCSADRTSVTVQDRPKCRQSICSHICGRIRWLRKNWRVFLLSGVSKCVRKGRGVVLGGMLLTAFRLRLKDRPASMKTRRDLQGDMTEVIVLALLSSASYILQ
ncbi:hypothetical protein AKJ16_DCAP15823 [Drosera capensis]